MKFRLIVLVAGAVTALGMLTSPATRPADAAAAPAPPKGPVSTTPAAWTPSLATSGTDGTVEQIRQLVPCGDLMYGVGTFTQISQNGVTYDRNNAFSFDATTGAVSEWNPDVNGKINSVALSADCATAYLGGVFTSVGGTAVKNIASVDATTGAVNTGFTSDTNGQVSALLMSGSHLLVGGFFTSINNSDRGYFASLDPSTGGDDGYVDLNISGSYQFVDQAGATSGPNPTRVYNFALSPDKTKLLAMGVFTSVGGQARRQIFMLDLGGEAATVNPWYSTEFDQNCAVKQPFWLQDASWAPDQSRIYIATTGLKPATGPGFLPTERRAGLCDVAAAFPATAGPVRAVAVDYTGCDTLFSTAADASTAYFGGHQRWASNPNGCDVAGPGAVEAPGLVGFSASTGKVNFNPTRARGLGAVDMLVTPAGLWVASDNFDGSESCGGVAGHAGICFLPYAAATED